MLNNIIYASYGVPCVVLYVLTVAAIIPIRKQLSPSFVAIYIWNGVINLLTYLNSWIAGSRLINEKWFAPYYHFAIQSGIIAMIHQFLINYLYFAQNINSFLLTVDRFFSI
ncbi:hypothetical protein PMAYCL1PPCAC_05244, partial [Pristionchus mayeri]